MESVNAKVNFEVEGVEHFSEKLEGFELKEKDNKGDLLTFGVTKLENEIYKGFMYSNVENKTNYDTDYNTLSTLCVLNNNISDQLTMVMEENKFILKAAQDKEVDKNQEPIKKEDEVYQKLILQYKIKKYSKYL